MEFKHTLIFFIFAHYLKLHRDALMGMFWSGDSLPVVPRQAAATARPCSSPDTLRGMETWQGFRLLPPPPDLLFRRLCCKQTLLQTQQRLLRAILKGLQTPAWFLLKQISTNLRHDPTAPALGKITALQLIWARCHGSSLGAAWPQAASCQSCLCHRARGDTP